MSKFYECDSIAVESAIADMAPVKEDWSSFLKKVGSAAAGGFIGMLTGCVSAEEIMKSCFKIKNFGDKENNIAGVSGIIGGVLGAIGGLRLAAIDDEKDLAKLFEKEELKKHCIQEADKCLAEAKKEHKDVSTDVIDSLDDSFTTDYRLKDKSSFFKKFLSTITKYTITLGKYTFIASADKKDHISTLYVIFFATKENKLVKCPIPVPDVSKMQ